MHKCNYFVVISVGVREKRKKEKKLELSVNLPAERVCGTIITPSSAVSCHREKKKTGKKGEKRIPDLQEERTTDSLVSAPCTMIKVFSDYASSVKYVVHVSYVPVCTDTTMRKILQGVFGFLVF